MLWQGGLCGERGVAIPFLTEHGRFLARVQGPVPGNVLLRREQYRRADDTETSAQSALDMMEELRPCLGNRLALSLAVREVVESGPE